MALSKDEILSGKSGIAKFFNSIPFIWILALITFIFWYTGEDLAGIGVLCVLMGAVLFFCEDATPVMACFTFLFFVFSETKMTLVGRELYGLMIIIPIVGFVYNIIRFKAKKFRMNGFSFSLLLVGIPWLLQGIGVHNRDAIRVFLCILLAVVYVLVYFLMYITSRREGKEFNNYYAHVLFSVSVLIVVQIVVYHLRRGQYLYEYDYTMLGWGTRNPVAAILALTMPTAFYFSTKKNVFSFVFILVGYLDYVVILLLQSRGVMLFASLAMPILVVYSIVGAKNKKINGIVNGVIIVGVIVLMIFKLDLIKEILGRLLTSKLDDNGRRPLWEDGVNSFLAHPIFGIGMDYCSQVYYDTVQYTEGVTFFHSTFIQIFASFGIFGGICYAYLYYWRYRVAFTDMDKTKFALVVGMVVFECYCFVDTVYFAPVGYYIMMVISLCMEKGLEDKQATPLVIDLIRKRRKE